MITRDMIKDVLWYSSIMPQGCIGIVLVETQTGHKAYIGWAFGHHEDADMMNIAGHGARFHEGHKLWPQHKTWAE